MLAVLAVALLAPASVSAPDDAPGTVRDSLTHYVVQQDADGAARLCRSARTTDERLLCRFRLYPLTQDAALLRDLPADEAVTSARGLALLGGLWGMRAATAPLYRVPTYGRRSERLVTAALARDATEPYALLVRGQSLYYKPRTFGGDVAEARRTFERLRAVLGRTPVPGLHPFEPEVWVWMCVRRTNAAEGTRMQRSLLARRPPPLFRQFLTDPP